MASSRGLRSRAIRDHFSELPQPGKAPVIETTVSDKHLKALENYIDALSNHILEIQERELAITKNFSEALRKANAEAPKKGKKDDFLVGTESARNLYLKEITDIREKRKQYREMLYDALQERKKLWDSMQIQRDEEEILRRKMSKLHALPEEDQAKLTRKSSVLDAYSILFLVFQVGLIILFAATTEYEANPSTDEITGFQSSTFYTFYTNIALIVFIGFGFMMSSLKKYGFGAIGFSFSLAAFALQWSTLTLGFFHQERLQRDGTGDWEKLNLTINTIIWGLYGATATLVALSAVIGKTSPIQSLMFAAIFIPFFSLNHWIGYHLLYAYDLGGSIYIFTFAAIFGVTFAKAFTKEVGKDMEDTSSSYESDMFSIFGTIFLWILWPSFNAALAPNLTQHRVIINTVLALCTSCIFTFIFSRRSRAGKFLMADIQRATIAGGIAMASVTSYLVSAGAAMVTGAVAGSASTLGLVYLQPFMHRKLKIEDPLGVTSIYLIPGLIGAIAGILSAGVASDYSSVYGQALDALFPERDERQAGWNLLVLIITIAIAFASGGLFGLIFKYPYN